MRNLQTLLIWGWLILISGILPAQERFVPGEILVSLHADISPASILKSPKDYPDITWSSAEKITEVANIWRIRFEPNTTDGNQLLQYFKNQPVIRFAQYNHFVDERSSQNTAARHPNWLPMTTQVFPDDPLFESQWHLYNSGQGGGLPGADIGALPAWDITTGGVTATGDTVVVAVIDGGICPYCDEFGDNLWVNHAEIPNDGIDNDNNGYFDDYRGWNVNAQNDEIVGYSTAHGTSVSGIIGAKGNNGVGISGVMWNTKLMFIAGTSGSQTTESQILAGYDYVWKARKTYNETNGTSGAYVVAVNCSFGINFATPSQSPLWCDILDKLGEVGILTIGATANGAWNVDEVGDIPTTCPSDYLITVTSLDFEDQKAPSASWGPQSVDLGSYGAYILSLTAGPSYYGVVSGTSFAAPQVSGAIGLLFSAPCSNLVSLSHVNPSVAAITAKNYLLSTTRPNSSLNGLTVTNGRLQIYDLLQKAMDECVVCPLPYWLSATSIDSNSVSLSWVITADVTRIDLKWRQEGTTNWNEMTDVTAPLLLNGLTACTTFEYQLKSVCDSIQSSDWSPVRKFTTDGCCAPPENISVTTEDNSANISWSPVTAALSYHVKYKIHPDNIWTVIENITSNSLVLNNLQPCSSLEICVRTQCVAGVTDYTAPVIFQTTGCGACYDKSYCTGAGNNAGEEWIKRVEIGTNWAYESEGFQGYQDFTGQSSIPLLELHPYESLTTTIFPDFQGLTYAEMFRIYVDFNLDGDFGDADELVFDPGYAHDGPVTDNFITPFFISEGITRMRVMMKFKENGFLNLPMPCETFDYGQVEDYCVKLSAVPVSTAYSVPRAQQLNIFPNPVHDYVVLHIGESASSSATVIISDYTGRDIQTIQAVFNNGALRIDGLNNLVPGIYQTRVILEDQHSFWGKMMKI